MRQNHAPLVCQEVFGDWFWKPVDRATPFRAIHYYSEDVSGLHVVNSRVNKALETGEQIKKN